MKKSLVALAAMAVAGIASAQSSVTLFGIVDASISHYSGNNGGPSKTVLGNSGLNTSRLGFRGVEDLGGGLAASFWLEGGLNNDDGGGSTSGGAFDFRRRSTVSLSGGFGEIRLGRDLTATHHNDDVFSPFGTNGVGTNIVYSALAGTGTVGGVTNGLFQANPNQVRSSNMIGYFLPSNLGGFYGQVQYGLHENNSGSPLGRAGQYAGGRFGYANGPVDVAIAYGESKGAPIAVTAALGNPDVRTLNVAGSYDFGVVKLFGELSNVRFEQDYTLGFATDEYKQRGGLIGLSAPVGAGVIKASYSFVKLDDGFGGADPKANKLALGYVHNLSKRTALYATVARATSKNGYQIGVGGSILGNPSGADGKNSATGYDFGIRHSF